MAFVLPAIELDSVVTPRVTTSCRLADCNRFTGSLYPSEPTWDQWIKLEVLLEKLKVRH